jgi:uncharacterized protein YqeY
MALFEKISADVKEAMKAHDAERVSTLRFVIAQLNNRQIEKRGKGDDAPLSDDETVDVLRKEVKKRREAADLFRQGGNADSAESEERELAVILTYLPPVPTEEEIRKVVSEVKASGKTAFPEIMKEAMGRLKGADGALVSKIIKEG